MNKRLALVLVTMMLIVVPLMAAYAERVSAGTIEDSNLSISDENRPFVNAVNNVQNNGWLVTDGEYLYCRTGGNTHVARIFYDFTG